MCTRKGEYTTGREVENTVRSPARLIQISSARQAIAMQHLPPPLSCHSLPPLPSCRSCWSEGSFPAPCSPFRAAGWSFSSRPARDTAHFAAFSPSIGAPEGAPSPPACVEDWPRDGPSPPFACSPSSARLLFAAPPSLLPSSASPSPSLRFLSRLSPLHACAPLRAGHSPPPPFAHALCSRSRAPSLFVPPPACEESATAALPPLLLCGEWWPPFRPSLMCSSSPAGEPCSKGMLAVSERAPVSPLSLLLSFVFAAR
mmetsp:Transcript_35501/g.92508  ORF Transcript_35501/g.92508 Transcript_35501/m.92508 type:complete len:257 (+) Transcript_35501:1297-2067(+)